MLARTDGPFLAGRRADPHPAAGGAGARGREGHARSRRCYDRVQPDEHVLLVLRGLHAEQQPNIVVQVYLGLSEGEKPPHDAGRSALRRHAELLQRGTPAGAEGVHGPDQFDSFDVSDVIQKLRVAKKLADPVNLTLQPVGEAVEGSKP